MMGQYDILIIAEAPNDETVGEDHARSRSLGNVRTETYRVFTEPEFRLVGSLS